MPTYEAWVGARVTQAHEVEIDASAVAAFWRLGRAIVNQQPRDREVFTLGRCIGQTSGLTSTLQAFGERDDPSSFPLSKLMYGGDQPMLDAYWQSPDDPVVFVLARQVYERQPQTVPDAGASGSVIFDISSDHPRLAGLRVTRA